MSELKNYQCPNCGGPLHFDAQTQTVKCDNCGSEFTADEIEALSQEREEGQSQVHYDQKSESLWGEDEISSLKAYSCPSCGAELLADENMGSFTCPYCANPTVVPSQFSGALRPDYILPFKTTKDDAKAGLKEFYKGKPLLPRAFKDHNHIEEIKGVYVPFWLYSSTADTDAVYHAKRINTHRQGDDRVTVTEHYRIRRQGSVDFTYVPADASSKMPDIFMDSVEPFDFNEMVPFQMSYLAGYLADKYDITPEEDATRVNTRMRTSAISMVRSTVSGYSSLVPEKENVYIRPGIVTYAFLPVWMLSTRYNGKSYLFTMNGQTGKFIGDDLPADKFTIVKFFLLITVIGIIILYIVAFGFGLGGFL